MKHTILFVAANPADTVQLALDQECTAIEHELRIASGRDDFDLRSKWAVSIDDLMRYLNQLQPAILHFSGHGIRGGAGATGERGGPRRDMDKDAATRGGIILQGRDGSQHVSDDALAAMIATASPATRLVVLNACYSASVAEAIRHGVGCVVGMDGAINDDAARSFAVAFYRALGHRRSIGNAVAQAVATLRGKQQLDVPPVCKTGDGVIADQVFLSPPDALRSDPPAPVVSLQNTAALQNTASQPRTVCPPQSDLRGSAVTPPSPISSVLADSEHYDLFLIHPSANKASARALYDLLQPDIRVFLDDRSLLPSGRRGQAPLDAHRASRATVILISQRADAAWYLGEEIVAALALHRASPEAHHLLPVLLEPGIAVPYRLAHVQAIDATAAGGLPGVASNLREQVTAMRPQSPPAPAPAIGPVPMRSRTNQSDHFRLHDRLGQLTDQRFEQIVLDAGVERATLAPRTAPLAARVLDVAQLAALDHTLCRRVLAELDRRAPWTRQ